MHGYSWKEGLTIERGRIEEREGLQRGEKMGMAPCHSQGGNQALSYTGRGELRSDDLCVSVGSSLGLEGEGSGKNGR